MIVFYGNSSGPVPPIDPLAALAQGLALPDAARPSGTTSPTARASRRAPARCCGEAAAGRLKVRIDRTFPLAEAAEAHRALEGRQTTGKVLLLP